MVDSPNLTTAHPVCLERSTTREDVPESPSATSLFGLPQVSVTAHTRVDAKEPADRFHSDPPALRPEVYPSGCPLATLPAPTPTGASPGGPPASRVRSGGGPALDQERHRGPIPQVNPDQSPPGSQDPLELLPALPIRSCLPTHADHHPTPPYAGRFPPALPRAGAVFAPAR